MCLLCALSAGCTSRRTQQRARTHSLKPSIADDQASGSTNVSAGVIASTLLLLASDRGGRECRNVALEVSPRSPPPPHGNTILIIWGGGDCPHIFSHHDASRPEKHATVILVCSPSPPPLILSSDITSTFPHNGNHRTPPLRQHQHHRSVRSSKSSTGALRAFNEEFFRVLLCLAQLLLLWSAPSPATSRNRLACRHL